MIQHGMFPVVSYEIITLIKCEAQSLVHEPRVVRPKVGQYTMSGNATRAHKSVPCNVTTSIAHAKLSVSAKSKSGDIKGKRFIRLGMKICLKIFVDSDRFTKY